ncbi:MAG: hypothetical protein U0X91_27555 [Spirosomataceae bacterium]
MIRNLLLYLLCCSSYLSRSQTITLQPQEVRQEGDKIIIVYEVKGKPTACYKVKTVQFTAGEKIITATKLSGELTNITPGTRQIEWEYKADSFFADTDVEVKITLENCMPFVYKPHSLKLKIAVAGIGVAAGYLAYSIKNNFTSKVNKLNELSVSLPQVNGQITSQTDYDTWRKAYTEAENAKKSVLLNAFLGIAGVAGIYEIYLLTTKRKVKMKGLTFNPPTTSSGIGIAYRF